MATRDTANHMKKLMVMNNPQGATDARGLHDLAVFTEGAIDLDPSTYPLQDFVHFEYPLQKAKKKKRK